MSTKWSGLALALGLGLLLQQSRATLIPRLSFEELTDSSELVVAGHVISSWTAWDSEHKYIWTHYTMSIDTTFKGTPSGTVEFAEPGGVVNGVALNIVGAIHYRVGDNVAVFLARMPNGYLRTAGWAQGKYSVDTGRRVHGQPGVGPETMSLNDRNVGRRLATLEGMSISELGRLVKNRVNATQGSTK